MLPAVFLTIGIIYGGKTTARMIRDWYDKARKRAEKGEQKKIVKTILGDTIKFRPRKII
jgi:endonuclease YncB( thermonuclease family)